MLFYVNSCDLHGDPTPTHSSETGNGSWIMTPSKSAKSMRRTPGTRITESGDSMGALPGIRPPKLLHRLRAARATRSLSRKVTLLTLLTLLTLPVCEFFDVQMWT